MCVRKCIISFSTQMFATTLRKFNSFVPFLSYTVHNYYNFFTFFLFDAFLTVFWANRLVAGLNIRIVGDFIILFCRLFFSCNPLADRN